VAPNDELLPLYEARSKKKEGNRSHHHRVLLLFYAHLTIAKDLPSMLQQQEHDASLDHNLPLMRLLQLLPP
jgi:hypothetical protein